MRQDDSTVRKAEVVRLIERLRAMKDSGRRALAGGSISADGKTKMWGGEKHMVLVNPDGPAAADMLERLATLESSPADGAGGAWPEKLTPELRAILGLMCFQFIGPAHRYKTAGEFVGTEGKLSKRAEDEQAFMLHKLIGYWFAHGAEWAKAAQADLNRVKALTPTETGEVG